MGSGILQSLMTVDIVRVVSIADLPYRTIILVLVHMPLALAILSLEMDAVVVAPLVSLILTFAAIPVINRMLSLDSTRWSEATDRRTKLMSSILSSITAIRLGAYEAAFAAHYLGLREKELAEVRRYNWRDATTGFSLNVFWGILRCAIIIPFALYCAWGGPPCAIPSRRSIPAV
jgi:hypothetical protein